MRSMRVGFAFLLFLGFSKMNGCVRCGEVEPYWVSFSFFSVVAVGSFFGFVCLI